MLTSARATAALANERTRRTGEPRRTPMNRFLLSAIAAFAAFFGVRALIRALASDETKIRWVVEDMVKGFNTTHMSLVLDGLAHDYRDETSGADRELVHAGLAHLFFENVDTETKRFLQRVEIPAGELAIEIDGERATVDFLAQFFETRGTTETPAWKARGHASLAKTKDGWKIVRSEERTLSGRPLY
jgi:hypothetical protein